MDTKHSTSSTPHTTRRSGLKIPSSWITSVLYKSVNDGTSAGHPGRAGRTVYTGYLAVFTSRGDALLHGDVPSYLAGLVQAGEGGRSVGSAYNSLIRSKGYPYQHVTDSDAVRELKEMMK